MEDHQCILTVLLDLWINYGCEHQTNEVNADQMNNAFDQNQETQHSAVLYLRCLV